MYLMWSNRLQGGLPHLMWQNWGRLDCISIWHTGESCVCVCVCMHAPVAVNAITRTFFLHLANRKLLADSCPHSLPTPSKFNSASWNDTPEVKKKDFQCLRKAINVKSKISNIVEAWKVWLISLISMIKVFTLLQSPSGLTCSSMVIMYMIQDFPLIFYSSQLCGLSCKCSLNLR